MPRGCGGYLVYLFQDDERKVRPEGPFLLSEYTEKESAFLCISALTMLQPANKAATMIVPEVKD